MLMPFRYLIRKPKQQGENMRYEQKAELQDSNKARMYEEKKKQMSSEKIKTSWWSLTIQDYPNYQPSESDLEHIAKCIKDGYDQGQLIQEGEDE